MDGGLEERLVGFKDHSVVHLVVFVQIEPGPIGAGSALHAIDERPPSRFFKPDMRLELRKQIVLNLDVAGAHPPYSDDISGMRVKVAELLSKTY